MNIKHCYVCFLGSLQSSRIQGVTIVGDILLFIAWFLAYFDTMIETQDRYGARLSHYSSPLLLFWGLVFITNNLVLISWNSNEWWFQRTSSVEQAEFILFWLRYSFSALILLLGMKAPGLYKSNYQVSVDDSEVPGSPTVSTVSIRSCSLFEYVDSFRQMTIYWLYQKLKHKSCKE